VTATTPGSSALTAGLHDRILAPLVLGGAVRPVHAIGVRAALALDGAAPDGPLAALVRAGRMRAARRIVPVDTVPDPGRAEWALAAALNDVFQSVSPAFATPLRRGMARRILGAAEAILDRTARAKTAAEALGRHCWFSRLFELRRTDTTVSWWIGSQTFAGEEPPARLRAWPEVRHVTVTKKRGSLFDLEPLAVPREQVVRAMIAFFSRSPLTDFATCTRNEPPFAWSPFTVGFVAEPVGRRLALRAVALSPAGAGAVDDALGRATRTIEPSEGLAMAQVLRFLGERALAAAIAPDRASADGSLPSDAIFARALGAFAARTSVVEGGDGGWPASERSRLLTELDAAMAKDRDVESFVQAYGLG
jgi:hypothetical protein